jgi:DNA mismatch endonuclease (patch repair protein)
MTDHLTPELRSWNMSRIRSSGTTPEAVLGRLLSSMLAPDQIVPCPKSVPGKPDYWIPHLRVAIFADGCFFHKCAKHCRMPNSNVEYWKTKIERNQKRDVAVNKELRKLGILPVRIWEHDLGRDTTAARVRLRRMLWRRRRSHNATPADPLPD